MVFRMGLAILPLPANATWVLTTIARTHSEPERLFIVAGIPFFISYEVEPLVSDQVFDWDDKGGVVSHAA